MAGNYGAGGSNTQWSQTPTPASSQVVKATQTATPGSPAAIGGRIWNWFGTTAGAAAYLQFFDATAVPSNSTVPLFEVALPIGSTTPQTIQAPNLPRPIPVKTGIVWAVSSTQGTYTAAAIQISMSVEYT